MNSKVLLISILILVSCGLKTNPTPPGGTNLPSIENQYKYKKQTSPKKVEEKKEDKKKKAESEE